MTGAVCPPIKELRGKNIKIFTVSFIERFGLNAELVLPEAEFCCDSQ